MNRNFFDFGVIFVKFGHSLARITEFFSFLCANILGIFKIIDCILTIDPRNERKVYNIVILHVDLLIYLVKVSFSFLFLVSILLS